MDDNANKLRPLTINSIEFALRPALHYTYFMEYPASKYASAVRTPPEQLLTENQSISTNAFIQEVFNAMPWVAAVLDKHRQVIFANNTLLASLGISDLTTILGSRPGEILGCIHAQEERGGCGTAEACRFCGALRAILECQQKGISVENECRVRTNLEGREQSLDLKISARPFIVSNDHFIIITLTDISNEKRRRSLETIFFHDIINSAGGLKGLVDIMRSIDDPVELKELLSNASEISRGLIEEILSQRELVAAENGELVVNLQPVEPNALIQEAIHSLAHHEIMQTHHVTVDVHPLSDIVSFSTDEIILKRVLINMLKNAVEASPSGSIVSITSKKTDTHIIFTVCNPGYMPAEVQAQVFQRSFSTKGANRGLGTYSMKLLTEQYLGGKLTFSTKPDSGTEFSASIPLNKASLT